MSPVNPTNPTDKALLMKVGRTILIDATTLRIVRALREVGVEPILLKGPSLRESLYRGDAALRTYGDCDLLVALLEMTRVEQVLTYEGFRSAKIGAIFSQGRPHARTWTGDTGVALDLHHTIPLVRVSPAKAIALLRAHTSQMRLGTETVTTLDPVGLAAHVALHSAHHGPQNPQSMRDLAQAIDIFTFETWREASELAGDLKCLHAFLGGLVLDQKGADLVNELGFGSRSRPRTVTPQPMPQRQGLDWMSDTWSSLEPMDKAQFLFRNIFPRPTLIKLWSEKSRIGRMALVRAYFERALHLIWELPPSLRARSRGLPPTD